jgi:heme/copper-type cytochrome/quinol oxidase subunit 4
MISLITSIADSATDSTTDPFADSTAVSFTLSLALTQLPHALNMSDETNKMLPILFIIIELPSAAFVLRHISLALLAVQGKQ